MPQLEASLPRSSDDDACRQFLKTLAEHFTLFVAKSYRADPGPTSLPILPCLDHEAQLTGNPAPHVSVYLEDDHRDLHEVVIIPRERQIFVDVAATLAETTPV